MKKLKIKIILVDKIGFGICYRGYKIGESFDYDIDCGKICLMVMYVVFFYVDIFRYGGMLLCILNGEFCFCCFDVDIINVFCLEIVE